MVSLHAAVSRASEPFSKGEKMLQITADMFSGRPNPSWVVVDETEARAVMRDLSRERQLVAEGPPRNAGLGLRGFIIEPLNDELAGDFRTSGSLYLAAGTHAQSGRASELAERLIGLIDRSEPALAAEEAPALDEGFREFLTTQLERTSRSSVADIVEAAPESESEEGEISAAVTCTIELSTFNPGFWNND